MLWGLARGAAIKVLVETGEPVHCSEYEGSWLTSRIGFENCSGHIGGHHLVASIVYENTFLFNLTCTPLEQELINKFFYAKMGPKHRLKAYVQEILITK